LWEEKMRRNHERDERSSRLAAELGWQVVRMWECEIVADPEKAAHQVLGLVAP
jgi:DNA mismatch endonuclease (patch repair protein)